MKRYFGVLAIILTTLLTSCNQTDNSQRYQSLTDVCDSMLNATPIPGMVAAVWAPDKNISFVYAAGIADYDTQLPMDKNFHFRIGSNTKTVVNTRFLQLVDSGYLSLKDPLKKFFPDFPQSDKITLEMLTDMTSGIKSYTQCDSFQMAMYNHPEKVWTMDELIGFSRNQPFHFEPGTGIDYCNTNTQMLGRIIEMITHDKLQHQIQKYIIEPLNLKETHFLTSGRKLPYSHPKGYYDGNYKEGYPEFSEKYDISWALAAGSMVSTVYDLKKYVEALNSGFFLSDSLQELRMEKKILFRKPDVSYSIGAAWFGDYYGHDGGLPGFTSTMVHSNKKNCTIIVWFNCNLDEDNIHTDHIFKRFDQIIYNKKPKITKKAGRY